MEHATPHWLSASLVYLAAAVLAVPIARLLGLGAIIGYLAAGIVIVREAGGLVSGFQKDTFSLYGQELVATNGRIHHELLDVINQRSGKS